jgi:phosphatidylinositol kinase/protein kinase (PI-3  family)
VNTFGVSGTEVRLCQAYEDIMRVVRDNTSSVIAQLEMFLHEPVFVTINNGTYGEWQSTILDRVSAKLSGNEWCQFWSLAPHNINRVHDKDNHENGPNN